MLKNKKFINIIIAVGLVLVVVAVVYYVWAIPKGYRLGKIYYDNKYIHNYTDYTVKEQFSLNIKDIDGNPHNNYILRVEYFTKEGLPEKISEGVVFRERVKDFNKPINLENGYYILTITNCDNPSQVQEIAILVNNERAVTDKLNVYTDFFVFGE